MHVADLIHLLYDELNFNEYKCTDDEVVYGGCDRYSDIYVIIGKINTTPMCWLKYDPNNGDSIDRSPFFN